MVIIIPHRRHMHHALNGIRQLDIHAPGRNAGYNAFKHFPDMRFHVFGLFQLVCLPLCLVCPAFHFTGLLCSPGQKLFVMLALLFIHPPAQAVLDNAVNLQIRITADWRCEMAVILCSQPEMAQAFRRIFRTLHGTQRQAAYQVFLRRSRNLR